MSATCRRTASLALAAVVLAAAGCGSSGSGSSGPTATHAGGASASPTASGTPDDASYRPAGGPAVTLQSFTARAPSRWKLDHGFGRAIVFAEDPHYRDELTFSDTSVYPGTPIARAERIVSRDDTWTRPPRSDSRVVLDGDTFFHLTGPAASGSRYDVFGHVSGSRLVELAFHTAESPGVRQRLLGSVLASVRLR